MSLELPDWADKNFISACLQDGKEDKNIIVNTFKISSLVPPGNNFGSCMLRADVDYLQDRTKDINVVSLVIKAPLIKGPVAEYFEENTPVEPLFYSQFLPLCRQVSSRDMFAPKDFLSPIPGVIVMEDLKAQGYVMCDRVKKLDFEHCQLYVIASATFHALSVAVHKKHPELVESLGTEKLYSDDIDSLISYKKFVISGIRYFANKLQYMDGYKKYSTILSNSATAVWDVIVDLYKPCSTINTLTQGDPWITNMMFKYDPAGKVADIRLIDFQMLRYTSPVHDLIYFIWTSANHEVRDHRLEDLYHLYCNTFNCKMNGFNCPERLLYNQLLEQLDNLCPVILKHSACEYPVLGSAKGLDVQFMERDCNENTCTRLFAEYYNDEYCKYELPRIVKQLDSVGVFKYLDLHCCHDKENLLSKPSLVPK